MLEYKDFYSIAEYGNEAWKGCFSAREIAENAYIYYADFQWSKKNNEVSHTIQELVNLLKEDESEECKYWVEQIMSELDFANSETIRISGIIFEHGKDDYGLWEGFVLSKEDENAIWKILQKYDTEGCSVRGTRKEIADEML